MFFLSKIGYNITFQYVKAIHAGEGRVRGYTCAAHPDVNHFSKFGLLLSTCEAFKHNNTLGYRY